MRLLIVLGLALSLPACGTLSNGRGWGEDAISPVSLARVGEAALHAAFDLQTLLPAVGAVVCATVDHWDVKVSTSATTHHLVFGSTDTAQTAADVGLYFLDAEALGTALATPSGADPKAWGLWKAKGVGVELTAELATAGLTSLLKETTNRPRPSGTGQSFPSGHASGAFSSATLANLNLNSLDLPPAVRLPVQSANVLLAAGVGWARIEADAHYPLRRPRGGRAGVLPQRLPPRCLPGPARRRQVPVLHSPLQAWRQRGAVLGLLGPGNNTARGGRPCDGIWG